MNTNLILSCIVLTTMLTTRCRKNDTPATEQTPTVEALNKAAKVCKSQLPAQSLAWLSDLVTKAEEDRVSKKHNGRYLGWIRSTTYKGRTVFFVKWVVSSVYGIMYDCDGASVTIDDSDIESFFKQAEKGQLVYSNMPF